MKNDEMLLKEIYQNSITSINVISGLLRKTTHQSMFDCLFEEMIEYRKIADTAFKIMNSQNILPDNEETYSKIAIWASMGKPSCRRLAKILISGSTEGFYSLVDSVNACTNAKDEVRHLAYELMALEDNNINNMRNYLKKE